MSHRRPTQDAVRGKTVGRSVRAGCEHTFVSTASLAHPPSAADEDDPEALADEIAALAAGLAASLGRWLELVGRFDVSGGWSDAGARSCAEWLAWRCSLSSGTAREHVRVARRLRTLPLVAEAFRRGELSFSKVRALTRLEHISDEPRVLELARQTTASQLERFVRLARRVTREEAIEAVEGRELYVVFEDDGSALIRGRVPAEDAALLLRALDHADSLLTPPPSAAAAGDESRPAPPATPARRADALAWIADRALGETAENVDRAGRTAGDRCEVLLQVDAALLSARTDEDETAVRAARPVDDPASSHLNGSASVAAETARRLCCDAGIVPVVRDGDRTLAVGRRTRSIPPAIRRALRLRRPTCAFPGCVRTRWLDAHHVVHWAHGGRTDLDNLVQLCRHHHRLVHEGGWSVRPDRGGGFEVRRPDGLPLVEAPAASSAPGPDDGAGRTADPGARRALMPLSAGDRYDLDLTIEALLDWTRPSDVREVVAAVA
jgi:Domain of unknown function (DUF222)/HNH endonuclease